MKGPLQICVGIRNRYSDRAEAGSRLGRDCVVDSTGRDRRAQRPLSRTGRIRL